MIHSEWFLVASSLTAAGQAGVESAAPPATNGSNVNVVGMPSGAQPPVGAIPATGAQTAAPGPGTVPAAPPRSPDMSLFWMMGGVMLLFILINVFAGRGERKRRARMLASMGKGDKVMMSGGAIGTIAEISDSEVVLRVEEGKVRFARTSVQQVLESRQAQGA
ncbi:MAG: hypothetical protein AMXMBFR58_02550 [Phycisphaerae bacterium]